MNVTNPQQSSGLRLSESESLNPDSVLTRHWCVRYRAPGCFGGRDGGPARRCRSLRDMPAGRLVAQGRPAMHRRHLCTQYISMQRRYEREEDKRLLGARFWGPPECCACCVFFPIFFLTPYPPNRRLDLYRSTGSCADSEARLEVRLFRNQGANRALDHIHSQHQHAILRTHGGSLQTVEWRLRSRRSPSGARTRWRWRAGSPSPRTRRSGSCITQWSRPCR